MLYSGSASNNPPDRFSFGNKERDADTGLMYFEARYLDTDVGRFTSVDPYFWSLLHETGLTDPQHFNAYSYARNNPVNYTDPTGLNSVRDAQSWAADHLRDGADFMGGMQDTWLNPLNWQDNFTAVATESFLDNAATVIDPDSGPIELGVAAGMLALDVVTAGEASVGKAVIKEAGEATVKKVSVYVAKNADETIEYVGITNNIQNRTAQHMRNAGREIEEVASGLTRDVARGVEQVTIDIHGMVKNGGTLSNKINSIADSNPLLGHVRDGAESIYNNTIGKLF